MVLPVLPHWAPLGEEAECQSRHIPSAWGFPAGKVFSWPCWGWNVQMYQGEAQQCLGAVQGKCVWCHTRLPGSTTGTGVGTGTAPLQREAADQTGSLFGAAKVSGAAHASSAPPGGYFAREGSLRRRFLWLGIKVPGSRPDSQYLAVAQPGSAAGFVCQAAAGGGREGEPRACGGRRARLSQRWGQPSCLSPGNMEMGVRPHGHPWEGQLGGRDAWERG